jgi:hypothetical protein
MTPEDYERDKNADPFYNRETR